MGENLPQKYNESIFRKFFNKLKNIWNSIRKRTKNMEENNNDILVPNAKITKENKMVYIKVNIDVENTDFKREEFMKNLTDNPELLENFSNDRLEKILQYYIEENTKKEALLKMVSV